jgi:hypothetical protein
MIENIKLLGILIGITVGITLIYFVNELRRLKRELDEIIDKLERKVRAT